MKKILLLVSLCAALFLPGTDLLADLFYYPGEYNRVYNEKIALELELKYLKKQYDNDRGNLLSEKKGLQDRISTLEGKISLLEKRLEDEASSCAKKIKSLERSLEITRSTSGEKVKSLLEENRRIQDQCRDDLEGCMERLARENGEHLKKIEELSGSCNKKISGMESLIADLRDENSGLKKLTETQKQELARMGRQAEDLEKQLGEEIRQGDISIKRFRDRIVININNKILFESGSAELRKGVYGSLDKIKGVLSGYPENRIIVEGHTDNVPISTRAFRDNWQLSTERALAVLDYLLRKTSLRPERFSAAGYGEFNPMVPNDTVANKALNRRVDITVVPSAGK
jgi:chemotaxis protein MotB